MYGKMKIEKIKNKYFLTLKNNELNNIFISSFLFTAKDFLISIIIIVKKKK